MTRCLIQIVETQCCTPDHWHTHLIQLELIPMTGDTYSLLFSLWKLSYVLSLRVTAPQPYVNRTAVFVPYN